MYKVRYVLGNTSISKQCRQHTLFESVSFEIVLFEIKMHRN